MDQKTVNEIEVPVSIISIVREQEENIVSENVSVKYKIKNNFYHFI